MEFGMLINATDATQTEADAEETAGKVRIAVVDDSPEFLEGLCRLLHSLHSVQVIGTGANGFDALELVATLRPDLLLMDVNMPELGGIEAAALIAYGCSWTNILLMSAEDGPEMRGRCA